MLLPILVIGSAALLLQSFPIKLIREWIELDKPIEIKDSYKGKPRFTNQFLLENCSESYQLFNINSDEQYRLMTELQKAYGKTEASVDDNEYAVYKINDTHTNRMRCKIGSAELCNHFGNYEKAKTHKYLLNCRRA